MNEIKVSSRFDIPTLKLGSAMHLRYRHPVFVVMRHLYLLLVPIGAIMIFFGEHTFGLLCVLMGPVLYLRKVFWQYRLIRGSKSSPQADQELQWTISTDGIRQKSQGYDKTFEWQDFHDRFLSPKGILMYVEKDVYFVLPGAAFDSREDFERVSKWCEEKIGLPSS
ncbi:MAG: YcxB family protein [Akkermansiaceae bacterium]